MALTGRSFTTVCTVAGGDKPILGRLHLPKPEISRGEIAAFADIEADQPQRIRGGGCSCGPGYEVARSFHPKEASGRADVLNCDRAISRNARRRYQNRNRHARYYELVWPHNLSAIQPPA